jgi:hypothetical protein
VASLPSISGSVLWSFIDRRLTEYYRFVHMHLPMVPQLRSLPEFALFYLDEVEFSPSNDFGAMPIAYRNSTAWSASVYFACCSVSGHGNASGRRDSAIHSTDNMGFSSGYSLFANVVSIKLSQVSRADLH